MNVDGNFDKPLQNLWSRYSVQRCEANLMHLLWNENVTYQRNQRSQTNCTIYFRMVSRCGLTTFVASESQFQRSLIQFPRSTTLLDRRLGFNVASFISLPMRLSIISSENQAFPACS